MKLAPLPCFKRKNDVGSGDSRDGHCRRHQNVQVLEQIFVHFCLQKHVSTFGLRDWVFERLRLLPLFINFWENPLFVRGYLEFR
jgi:hypothetical protein